MLRGRFWLAMVALLGLAADGAQAAPPAAEATKLDFFEREVRPIFVKHCYACHSADTKPAGGLRVDDRNGLLQGGAGGAAIVPGQPEASPLLARVAAGAKKRMPAEGAPLSEEQIAKLTRWVSEGAVWPTLEVKVERDNAEYARLRASHWAWQPLSQSAPPAVQRTAWPRDEIDRFVLASLEAAQLAPTADADKTTLLRRATYDLTGLPPTPAELDAFLADTAPNAFEKVVDRLLQSPAFGEQWGRHWLDVARYGESTGPSRNVPYPHAWRYRDYVIDAVNSDRPFTQFLREQIAGDLLPAANDAERNRQLIATGFLALGVKDVNQRFPIRFQMDNVDEQIDVVTRAVLGLTVSCARCHDHKFDPIPQTDYYALAGIFTSTEMLAGLRSQMGGSGLAYYVPKKLTPLVGDAPAVDPAEVARRSAAAAAAKETWEAARAANAGGKAAPEALAEQRRLKAEYDKREAELAALTDPAERGLVAHGVQEAATRADTELRIRGEAEKLGPVVPRGFLTAVQVPGAAAVNPQASGRLELAQWLTSDANPLTQRVFVNRVWSHLFGKGLVSTVDNFGVSGVPPTHPELLDYLAAATVADGGSLKRLVRRLVLTRTYQLSSAATSEQLARDPANNLLWRHSPRRLTTEEIRDSLLAAAGRLELARPAGSPSQKLKMVELRDNGPEANAIHQAAAGAVVRSLYLPQLRGIVPAALAAFDPVEQGLVTGSREVTTVPSQALFLLNSPFVREQAQHLAVRLLNTSAADDADRLQVAYRVTFGREPTTAEAARAAAFLSDYAASYRSQPEQAVKAGPSRPAAPGKAKAKAKAKAKPKPPAAGAQAGAADSDDSSNASANSDAAADAPEPLNQERQTDPSQPPTDAARQAAWRALAQALVASAEFRYLR